MPATFTFKQPKDNLFYLLVSLAFGAAAFYIGFEAISFNGLGFNTFIALLPPLLIAIPAYLFIGSVLTRGDYQRIDGHKLIRLDEINNSMQVAIPGNAFTIQSHDIKDVNLYKTWTILHLFVMPGYMKINLVDGSCFIISSLLATEDDLMPVLEGREVTAVTRAIYRLPAAQLSNCIC